ncbi:AAA family ATPase [Porticoccaceae bacterium]|nr:AAA family ATPase [Porticoccaceae bacterium]MDB2319393.1 AAA family ATPase [Porticoccaceae bacterium]
MSIYLKHFGLVREPFSIVPDPGFLYPSNHHRQAVAHLKYGLDREGGFILLTGEVGTGKTTLTRTMLKRLPAHVRVAYVLNSKLEVSDALASICTELSIELPGNSSLSFTKLCTDALNQDLLQAHAQGKKTLIVIEEAQNLTSEVLETLRLLSNLETHTHKLLHILLVGQPELLEILAQKELRQLNQRVVSRFHLLPLDKDDLANYVNHRLHRAGAKQPIFDSACMSMLYRLTKGVPRLINLVCQHSLLAAYSTEARIITPKLIKQASVEILGEQKSSQPLVKYWPHGLAAALLAIVVWLIAAGSGIENQEPSAYQEPSANKEPISLPTAPVPTAQTPNLNPFAELLGLWSVTGTEVYSQEDFIALAEFQGLQSHQISDAEVIDLEIINRPGIVRLQTQAGYLKSYLLTRIDSSGFTVTSGSDSQLLDAQAFRDIWSRSFIYLWRPPIEVERLALGDTDAQAVSWLQSQLQQVDQSAEAIISGGRYTQAIANQVLKFQREQNITADGVVGRETLLRLNQLTRADIPLLTEGSN